MLEPDQGSEQAIRAAARLLNVRGSGSVLCASVVVVSSYPRVGGLSLRVAVGRVAIASQLAASVGEAICSCVTRLGCQVMALLSSARVGSTTSVGTIERLGCNNVTRVVGVLRRVFIMGFAAMDFGGARICVQGMSIHSGMIVELLIPPLLSYYRAFAH